MVQTSASGQTAAEKAAANADAKLVILTHEYYTWSVCETEDKSTSEKAVCASTRKTTREDRQEP
jgi:hypothetical protein